MAPLPARPARGRGDAQRPHQLIMGERLFQHAGRAQSALDGDFLDVLNDLLRECAHQDDGAFEALVREPPDQLKSVAVLERQIDHEHVLRLQTLAKIEMRRRRFDHFAETLFKPCCDQVAAVLVVLDQKHSALCDRTHGRGGSQSHRHSQPHLKGKPTRSIRMRYNHMRIAHRLRVRFPKSANIGFDGLPAF